MTTDSLFLGIKAWLENRATIYPILAGLDIRIPGDVEKLVYPHVAISSDTPEEHAILRGVLTVPVLVELLTVPETTENAGTPQEVSHALNSALYDSLADVEMANFIDARPGIKVFDIRGVASITTGEDGRRSTAFTFTAVCCKA